MKFKAAILVEQKKPLIIDYIEFNDRLDYGQVLVEIYYSGICGSQIGEIDGVKGEDKYLPHLLGHEAVGKVLEVGQGVKTVKIDDEVILHWRPSDGLQSNNPSYLWNNKKINAGWVTTFNQYSVVSENRLTKIITNNEMERKSASLYGCAITTGFGVVENNLNLKIGNSLIVFGAGGIGLNIIQAASLIGANPIIAIDVFDNRLSLAKKYGATITLNSRDDDKDFNKLFEICNKYVIDCFVDNTGSPDVIKFGYNIVKSNGCVVLVGVPKGKTEIYTLPLHFGKKLFGSHGGDAIPHHDIPRLHNFFKEKNIDLNNLITNEYVIEDINIAIDDMKSGRLSGRCLIKL